jgi:hypothetical protein
MERSAESARLVGSAGSAGLIGLGVGLVLGIVWMWLGFGAAVLVGVLGLLGWGIGRVVRSVSTGRIDLGELWTNLQGRRAA